MPAVRAGNYSRMQPTPPPKTYPQDAACALLQLLFFMIKSVVNLHTGDSRTDSVMKKQAQLLQHIPEEEYISARQEYEQQMQEAQALKKAYETKTQDTSSYIGTRLLPDTWSVAALAGDTQAV